MNSRMMNRLSALLLVLMLAGYVVSCGGGPGQPDPDPNPNFDRLTATVSGGDGAALVGLTVRVEGTQTGVTTAGDGSFILNAGDFPNGVDQLNEISLGLNGIVVGSTTVVPEDSPVLDIKLEPNDPATGNGILSGSVFSEVTGALLDNVSLTLFSQNGGVLMQSSANGDFSFGTVAAGTWQLLAESAGYHPELAVVLVNADETTIQHLALTPDGAITPGTGLKVKGTLTDSKTGGPVGGALISIYADSGYIGIPEPGVMDDVFNGGGGDAGSGGGTTGSPGTDPALPPPADDEDKVFFDDSMNGAPIWYDPQYQEMTTAADGSFEFANEVVGYSLWISYNKEGYLYGNTYEDINGLTGELDLELTIEPIIETDLSGTVVDETGTPVQGAYVEFIFTGGMGGNTGIMVPGAIDLGVIAEDGQQVFDDFGAPVPPSLPGDTDGEWSEGDSSAPAMGGAEDPSSDGVDNTLMQRFRWEQQQDDHSASDLGYEGYYSTTTGADGTFSFEGVPAGDYSVFASAYRHVAVSFMETIEEDPAENIVPVILENVPVGAVEGTVVDENGQVIVDVLVNAIQPNVDPFSYTDEAGHFRIDNIPVGQWLVSGYKQGYLTANQTVDIVEDGTITVNLTLTTYVPPETDLVPINGSVMNGADGSAVGGVDVVFTPFLPEFGHYYQHTQTAADGQYSVQLANTDYNVLVQKEGYEDIFMRIWIDMDWPQMDFTLFPIGTSGGSWGGPVPMGGAETDANTMPARPDGSLI